MIFVTVGTHEQQFNRLIEYMDKWAKNNNETVIIQTGFSTYEPINCEWSKMYPYSKMLENVKNARLVITHGGPSSFFMPLQMGKIPIVVPRKVEYDEHVNNHQVDFCNQVAQRKKNIIVVNDIDDLANVIYSYDDIVRELDKTVVSNNSNFCKEFERMVNQLVK